MNIARTRIRNVRLKPVDNVAPIAAAVDLDRRYIEQDIRDVLDAHSGAGFGSNDFAGYAIVVWSRDGSSTCSARCNEHSQIPTALVPDFVRNRLLADRIERWTSDAILRRLGYNPSA